MLQPQQKANRAPNVLLCPSPASLIPQSNYPTRHEVLLSTYTLVCLLIALSMRTTVVSIVGRCQQHTFQSMNAPPLLHHCGLCHSLLFGSASSSPWPGDPLPPPPPLQFSSPATFSATLPWHTNWVHILLLCSQHPQLLPTPNASHVYKFPPVGGSHGILGALLGNSCTSSPLQVLPGLARGLSHSRYAC